MSNFSSQATNTPESRNFMFSTNINKNISSPQRMQFSSSGNELSTGDLNGATETESNSPLNFPANSFGRSLENWSSPSLRSGESLDLSERSVDKLYMKAPETLNLDVSSFQEKLQRNNGIIIFKFGASWCKPCKVTEPHFNNFYNYLTSNENIHKKIECINIDVDDSFELYATMKRYRMVKGLPTFLAYYKNNNTYITDDSSIGSDINQLNSFFTRCLNKLNDM
jgi:thiol-disulfide isomerase/thioredoxin